MEVSFGTESNIFFRDEELQNRSTAANARLILESRVHFLRQKYRCAEQLEKYGSSSRKASVGLFGLQRLKAAPRTPKVLKVTSIFFDITTPQRLLE